MAGVLLGRFPGTLLGFLPVNLAYSTFTVLVLAGDRRPAGPDAESAAGGEGRVGRKREVTAEMSGRQRVGFWVLAACNVGGVGWLLRAIATPWL